MRFRDIPQFTSSGAWECDYDLEGVVRFIEDRHDQQLNMNPDFQRPHVWTRKQQIAWLEFFLRGGKNGRVIYFNHPGWMRDYKGEFVIVDGKQRCQAIQQFIHNKIRVFGAYFREYEDRRFMMHHTIRINVNDLKTRAEVLQWYIDMNAGGTPHTNKQIAKVKELLTQEPAP